MKFREDCSEATHAMISKSMHGMKGERPTHEPYIPAKESYISAKKKTDLSAKKPSVYQQKAICICRTLQKLARHKG